MWYHRWQDCLLPVAILLSPTALLILWQLL